jgi:hypothetical protein
MARHWSPTEDAHLAKGWLAGERPRDIGAPIGRTNYAVICRADRLDLPPHSRPYAPASEHAWSARKVAMLRRRWTRGQAIRVIAKALRTTPSAVSGKIHRLGIARKNTLKEPSRPRTAWVDRPLPWERNHAV